MAKVWSYENRKDIKFNQSQMDVLDSYFSSHISMRIRLSKEAKAEGNEKLAEHYDGAIAGIKALYREMFKVDCPIENLEE